MKFFITYFLFVILNACWGTEEESPFTVEFSGALKTNVDGAITNILQNAQANQLVASIREKKYNAVKKAVLNDKLAQFECTVNFYIDSLRTQTKHPYFNEFYTEKTKEAINAHLDKPLIVAIQNHIDRTVETTEISTDLSNAIHEEIQYLLTEDTSFILPEIKKNIITAYVHKLTSEAIKSKSFDVLIYLIYIKKELLKRIYNSLKINEDEIQELALDTKIYMHSSERTCFVTLKAEQKKLLIRIDKKYTTALPLINVLSHGESNYFINSEGNYLLSKEQADLHLILLHELVHMKHFVEDLERFNKDSASLIGYWPGLNQDSASFARLWNDAEEQRTVIGTQDSKEICELSIRMAEDASVRYPYLTIDDDLVDKHTINFLFKNFEFIPNTTVIA
ncbi:MAG: hypothetical protein Q8S21_06320 [Candidatus Paracaedibacteraceae bacterium]|nr:hypothetical protein [Candidatus Paracaedibacteraceae bacterium]